MKTCKGADTTNGVIQFTDVKIANGIHNTDLIRTSGIFTCENPGLYLISAYLLTDAKEGFYNMKKNNITIAGGWSSQTGWYQTTSMTVIEQLTVNDTISVHARMNVDGGYASCLTILQIQ